MTTEIMSITMNIKSIENRLSKLQSMITWHDKQVKSHYNYSPEAIIEYNYLKKEINKMELKLRAYRVAKKY